MDGDVYRADLAQNAAMSASAQPPQNERHEMAGAAPGRVVIVTGAAAGIGRACADRLAAAGWTVVGADRRSIGGAAGGSDGSSSRASTAWASLVMDVDDGHAVRAGVSEVLRRHGRIDALVAAAGWGVAGAAEFTPIDDARALFETNFWGYVRVVQAVLPHMRAQHGGRILLVSSMGGLVGLPFEAYYSASKFALEGFGESLAYEVAPFGITVTLLRPANTATDFSRRICTEADTEGVYATAAAKAIEVRQRGTANGVPPARVAAAAQRLLESRRPPRRKSAGRAWERSAVISKGIMPFRLFEAASKKSLGIG
jgi:NAD(P)-dependent dehydrogenase (short-subunit alcohol dehydrogenase family)